MAKAGDQLTQGNVAGHLSGRSARFFLNLRKIFLDLQLSGEVNLSRVRKFFPSQSDRFSQLRKCARLTDSSRGELSPVNFTRAGSLSFKNQDGQNNEEAD